jgi:hypothetical protein
VLSIRHNDEREVVTEIATTRALECFEQSARIANHSEVDVARGSRAFEAQLEDHTTFDNDAIGEFLEYASEKSIEEKELSKAPHIDAALRRSPPHSCFERLLEGFG